MRFSWASNPVLPNETVLLRVANSVSVQSEALNVSLSLCPSESSVGCSDFIPKVQLWSGGMCVTDVTSP